MPGRHSKKQKRQAKHIAASERARGMSPKDAERIGWATVNKQKARKSLEVISIDEAYLMKAETMQLPVVTRPPAPNRRRPEKPTVKMKPISNEEAAANLRAGKFHEKSLRLSLRTLARVVRKARR